MFSIGEFSRITGLTVKTLRFYHEQQLLTPALVDPQTGYRYYEPEQTETARVIAHLRGLEFPITDIKELLNNTGDDDLLDVIERHKNVLAEKIKRFRQAIRSIDQFISEERQARAMVETAHEVQEKTLDPMLMAGVRMKGCYGDCGKGFSKVARNFGRYLAGKPFLLHYDCEYKENDADFEACVPVRQSKAVEGISVRELPGGRCVSLMHKGPYEQLGPSYAKITQYIKDKGYRVIMPTREIYIKGPGMIFKGNPKNYLTEIQMLIEPTAGGKA
jgi:DNA-binding transcriptional MerR regulator